ncbi:IS200/IS605 family transposase [Streptomyces niveus]|uniref:IS200/IS605 family transposase n=1 Tax=Streptomyces niveus TaxID=193462 RepID=UPI00341CB382
MPLGVEGAHNLHAHLVFVTKYRKGVFDDAMLKRCEEIMREVCVGFETELREFNGERDHVHLLVHYPPKIALSKLIPRSYFAGSCGGAPLTVIRQYIEGQQRPL